jgi:hypothetical protein
MAAGIGRRRLEGEGPPLIAEDIVRLREAEGIGEIEVVRLEKAGDLHPLWYDWMLVIDLEDEGAQHPVEAFFEELYSVGARPILLREAQDD